MVTLDKDFGELAVLGQQPHVGIIRLVDIVPQQQAAVHCRRRNCNKAQSSPPPRAASAFGHQQRETGVRDPASGPRTLVGEPRTRRGTSLVPGTEGSAGRLG